MRMYFVLHDSSPVKQTRQQMQAADESWREQPFALAVAARRGSPNLRLSLPKRSRGGDYRLGGIDLEDKALLHLLDDIARAIDSRSSQVAQQLELVLLDELRRALPQDDLARANALSVQVVASGDRRSAIAAVQAYLRSHAADWYAA